MTTIAPSPFRASRYTTGAILLHWTIALLVLLQLAGGFAISQVLDDADPLRFDLYQLHKSLGVMVLVLTVSRILWRAFNPPPPEPASVSRIERFVAHAVHIVFYVLLLAIPLSGWLLISVSPVRVETVLFFVDRLPWPDLPGFAGMSADARATITPVVEEVHAVLAYGAGVLVALHVAGALKHHLADGHYLARMSPVAAGDGPRNSYGHATTWLATVIFFGAIVGAAAVARNQPAEVARVPATVSPDQALVLGTALEPAAGEDALVAAPDATAALAPLWSLEPAESALSFAVDVGGKPVEGRFERYVPTIRFDPDNLAGSSIDVAIETGSATTGPGLSADQLLGADGLAVAEFPTARFVAGAIRATEDGYEADGTLALRDAEVPVTLPFTLDVEGDRAHAVGSVTVDRTRFGVGAKMDPTGSTLGKEVTVTVDIVATRVDAEPAAASR